MITVDVWFDDFIRLGILDNQNEANDGTPGSLSGPGNNGANPIV